MNFEGVLAYRENDAEDARFRVLHLIGEDPEISQRSLAKKTGISLGKAHFLLRALIDKGFVKLGNFYSADDKRRYAYILTRKGVAEKRALAARFLERKTREYKALKAEIDALEASLKTSHDGHDEAGKRSNAD